MIIAAMGMIVIGAFVIWLIYHGNQITKKYFLDGHKIFFHEQNLEMKAPFKMRGRPDIVFENLQNGELVTGEFKYRSLDKVYMSDKVQLTAGKMLVEENYPHRKVSKKGVILLHRDGETKKVEIDTLSREEMLSLYDRFVLLIRKKVKPRGASNPHYCEDCSFFAKCKVRSC